MIVIVIVIVIVIPQLTQFIVVDLLEPDEYSYSYDTRRWYRCFSSFQVRLL